MNDNIGTKIGNTLGVVKAYDVEEDGSGWEKVLHLCKEMDVHKSLSLGQTINIQGNRN